ncbi:MAG: hypothetical protein WA823_10280 [Candidatus Acidiferrales bacterium]
MTRTLPTRSDSDLLGLTSWTMGLKINTPARLQDKPASIYRTTHGIGICTHT